MGGELPNSLIKDGAYLVTTLNDICEVLGYNFNKNKVLEFTQEEKVVLEVIKNGKTLVDDIIIDTGLKIFELMPVITSLEIKGAIIKTGGNEFAVVNL